MAIDRLQMVGQAIVRIPEIKPLVFDAGAKVPFAGNEKAVVVTEIIVKRIAAPKFGFFEIAAKRVRRLVREKLARVFFLWGGGRLRLKSRRSANGGRRGTEKQANKEQSYVFHRLRRGQRCIGCASQSRCIGSRIFWQGIIREITRRFGCAFSTVAPLRVDLIRSVGIKSVALDESM
jgi:hypothetical protein